MKALYTLCGGKIYRIDQMNKVPNILLDNRSGSSAQVSVDPRSKNIRQTFNISTLDNNDVLSNKEMYDHMIHFLQSNRVTDIDIVQNRYMVYIDYETVYRGKTVDSATVTRDIVAIDGIVPLGTNSQNENVFRHGKQFKTSIEFHIDNVSIPYGVMKSYNEDFSIMIYNIAILQDFSPFKENVHRSTYQTPYGYTNFTLRDNMENMEVIYSSSKEGVVFDPIKVNFSPRKMIFDIDILLTNYVDVYDNYYIEKLLKRNCELMHKMNQYNDLRIFDGNRCIHNPNKHCKHGRRHKPHDINIHREYFYKRTDKRNKNALLVVEDIAIDSDLYLPETMVPYSDVVQDIKDIRIGEYVLCCKIDPNHRPHGNRPVNVNDGIYYNPFAQSPYEPEEDPEDLEYGDPYSGEGFTDTPSDPDNQNSDPNNEPNDDPGFTTPLGDNDFWGN